MSRSECKRGLGLLISFLLLFTLIGPSLAIETHNPAEKPYVIVEEIRPGGICASPNSDNGASNLHSWKIASTLTYKINSDSIKGLDKDQTILAIQRAANAWDGNTAAILFSYGGSTTAKPGTRDGLNTVSFGGAPFGSIAVAYIWASNGVVQEVDMVLANGFKWAIGIIENPNITLDDCTGVDDRMDVQDIATHEFGHWVGVAHTSDNSANNAQTMFPFGSYKELFKQSLANGDKEGLKQKYGP